MYKVNNDRTKMYRALFINKIKENWTSQHCKAGKMSPFAGLEN